MESREDMSLSQNHVFILEFEIGKIQLSPKLNSSFLGMPIGPLWAHKGPIWGKKLIILIKNHKIINKNIKIANLEISKVKKWFWNKDLSSLDSIN